MERKYRFELGDLRALVTVVNVMLIIKFGLSVAWVGLAIACLGLAIDFIKYFSKKTDFRVNSAIIHCASIILNVYFMCI